MVRNPVQKTSQESWYKNNMKEAIQSAKNKDTGLRRSAKRFSRTRLQKLNSIDNIGDDKKVYQNELDPFCFVLLQNQEEELKRYIIDTDKLFRSIVMWWLSPLQNVTQQNLNSGSAQVQILPAAYRRFAMIRIKEIKLSAFRRSTIPSQSKKKLKKSILFVDF